jgi:hypothetical protein
MDDTLAWFGLGCANELGICVAIMHETWFELFFNNRPFGELVMNDNMDWILSTGDSLPDELVFEIGRKIERRYW